MITRMDNVLIVVEDLDAVIDFFVALGMEVEGRAPLGGDLVERIIALQGVSEEIAVLKTPDGHGRVELAQFLTPAAIRPEPWVAPVNTLGMRRIMFAVEGIDEMVARLLTQGVELVGEIVTYGDEYRLCFVRGPENIMIGLAEELQKG